MKESGCPTAWASLTFGNRIMNKYGVRRRGRNLPALVLLKQLWDGSGQGLLAKNAAGNTIRLSLNLWYHYYGNRMGYGKGRTAALLPGSRLTPLTVGISRSTAYALTYGSNENVRAEKSVQTYGMRNVHAGGFPGQVWNKNLLPDLASESNGPSSFVHGQLDQVVMPDPSAFFHALRMGARHATTIVNDRLPGADPNMAGGGGISKHFIHEPGFRPAGSRHSYLTDLYDSRASLPATRLAPVTVDISRPAVDALVDMRDHIRRVEKTAQLYGMRNASTGSHSFLQRDRIPTFGSFPMTVSPEFGALPNQAWSMNLLPRLTPGAIRLSPRSHGQSEQIAMPVMQIPQQVFRKRVRQPPTTTNDNVSSTVVSVAGQTSLRFLKSQDGYDSHAGINGQINILDTVHYSAEAEHSPVVEQATSQGSTEHSTAKTFLDPTERRHHPLHSNRVYGGVSLPPIRLIPVITGIPSPIPEDRTNASGENGKSKVAERVYGRRNTHAGDTLFTREGADLFQSKRPPVPSQTSISSSGKTWDETSPLVHKRAGHIPGASEKSPSHSTARAGNSSATPSSALVVDETITSGVYREGTGDGISVSEDFTDTKVLAASGRQAAIPAAELKRVADSVYKMVEKRIMIERERRGM